MKTTAASRGITFWLAEHPAIVGFRWSPDLVVATWPFLIASLTAYSLLATSLAALLRGRARPVPLGPLPALHSLAMLVASAVIFLGLLLSAAAEIRETRWYWRGRSDTTVVQWLLCFPIGTRPIGRVFFWSYAFYLTRFLHLLRTYLGILHRRPGDVVAVGVVRHSAFVCTSFLWLEFSQSFQVIAILAATLAQAVVFGHRFLVSVGLPASTTARGGAALVVGCRVALASFNALCQLGFLLLHFAKSGCNGIEAWAFNSVLNVTLLLFYVKMEVNKRNRKKNA